MAFFPARFQLGYLWDFSFWRSVADSRLSADPMNSCLGLLRQLCQRRSGLVSITLTANLSKLGNLLSTQRELECLDNDQFADSSCTANKCRVEGCVLPTCFQVSDRKRRNITAPICLRRAT